MVLEEVNDEVPTDVETVRQLMLALEMWVAPRILRGVWKAGCMNSKT